MALAYTRGEIKDRARSEWEGGCNVTLPSFTEDFSALNEAAIRHDVQHAAKLGYWGTLVASESGTTFEEYKQFLEIAADAAPDGFKIVAHLSFDTHEQVVEAAKAAEAVGAEAGLLSYEPSFRPKTSADVVAHTKAVSEKTDLALIAFAVPTWGFKPLHPQGFPLDAIEEIAKLETVAAVKFECGGAAAMSAFAHAHERASKYALVQNPMEPQVPIQARQFGVRWWGTSGYEAFGDRVPKMMKLLNEGSYEEAMEVFWSYHPGREAKGAFHATFSGANLIHRNGWKYLGWLQGFNGGLLRMPQMRLLPGQMKSLRAGLEASGFDLPADDSGFYRGRHA
jgi:4-hydroxy-tetrahydrodipicolinate synthase